MNITAIAKENYKPTFEEPIISKLQERAYSQLQQFGLPHHKTENFRFTDFKGFFEKEWDIHTEECAKESSLNSEEIKKLYELIKGESQVIVFVDGRLSSELSKIQRIKDKIEINTLSAAISNGDFAPWTEYFQNEVEIKDPMTRKVLQKERNFQNHINDMYFFNGLLMRVKKNAHLDDSLHLVYLQSHAMNKKIAPLKNTIVLEENARVSILEHHLGFYEGDSLSLCHTQIFQAEGSRLGHSITQMLPYHGMHFATLDARLKRNARYTSFIFSEGSKYSRNQVNISLEEEEAHCICNSLCALKNDQQSDNYSSILHLAPNTHSEQVSKSILNDVSHGVFQGHILLSPEAKGATTNQLNKNLLLSKKAQVHTQPQLEITIDDVKANHGATIGQLSDEELFYFQSRGINAERAREMLTNAFAYDLILKIDNDKIRHKLNHILVKKVANCTRKIIGDQERA